MKPNGWIKNQLTPTLTPWRRVEFWADEEAHGRLHDAVASQVGQLRDTQGAINAAN